MTRASRPRPRTLLAGLVAASLAVSCGGGSGQQAAKPANTVIQNKGSDTMVNLAQAWAEEYAKVAPDVEVEVSGGGSGVGIAALISGTVDIANSSRNLKPEEVEQAKKNTGKEPEGFMVGFDALAIYVHKDNPLDEITLEQLARSTPRTARWRSWSELGVKIPGVKDDRSSASAGSRAPAPTSSSASTCSARRTSSWARAT